jgi:drug/metabolite transporter (DMT)-like permease
MGYIFLAEPITWIQISGMSLVMAAMWLLVRNKPLNKKSSDKNKSDDFDGAEPLN